MLNLHHSGEGDNVVKKIVTIALNLNIWVVLLSLLMTTGIVWFIVSQNYKDYDNALEATKEEAMRNFMTLASLIHDIDMQQPDYFSSLIPPRPEEEAYESQARVHRIDHKNNIIHSLNVFEMSEDKYKAHQLELSEEEQVAYFVRTIYENQNLVLTDLREYVDHLQHLLGQSSLTDTMSIDRARLKHEESLIEAKVNYASAALYFFEICTNEEREQLKSHFHQIGVNLRCLDIESCRHQIAEVRVDLMQQKRAVLAKAIHL